MNRKTFQYMVPFRGLRLQMALSATILVPGLGAEAPFRAYVADIGAESVTIAWGRSSGGAGNNTIGRGAAGSGALELTIANRSIHTQKAWETVGELKPDTVYPYTIRRNGAEVASGVVRTWPSEAKELTFFVVGDFGNGSKRQYEIARRMEQERSRLASQGVFVRFVISTGDNLYGKFSASGAADKDWEEKFFRPYAATLAAIPFKAVLGNHDGDESEKQADLAACLDNLFMPSRWYRFTYGGFAEFFALDSTKNTSSEQKQAVFRPGGEQSQWLEEQSARPALPWRIAVMHHPMFTAGPQHKSALPQTRHWFEVFRKSGFQMVFSGHEHNLQFSQRNEQTGGMQFVLSGAGGELRKGDLRNSMAANQIRAWANQSHFLVVRISNDESTVEPIGADPMRLRDASGQQVSTPISVKLQEKQ